MKNKKIKIKPNKSPSQKRSLQMYEDILEAAIRVLIKYPGTSFTTIKVAEIAGISVGSLYQYFPNKESILFELQMREAKATNQKMLSILSNEENQPIKRIKLALYFFFNSEWEERKLRTSLQAALVDLKRTKEFTKIQEELESNIDSFLRMHFKDKNLDSKYFCFVVSTLAESLSSEINNRQIFQDWSDRSINMLLNFLR